MEIILEYIDKIGLTGIIVAITSFLVGIKVPDWDFKLKLQHRNILTHSPIFLFLLLELYNKQPNDVFRLFIGAFALSFGVHFIFDIFPKGWSRGALLHLPIARVALSGKISKILFFIFIVVSLWITVKMTANFYEYIFFLLLALWCFLKNTSKEEKFFRPCMLFMVLFIGIGCFKFKELRDIKKMNKHLYKIEKQIEKQVKKII